MSYEHILIDGEDGVGIVTLNRPDKLNAMNRQLSSELHDAVKRMEADEAIGLVAPVSSSVPQCLRKVGFKTPSTHAMSASGMP